MEIPPETAEAWWQQGYTHLDQENYTDAITAFTHALAHDPRYADAYLDRGWAYFYTRRWPEALADWQRAVDLNPDLDEETLLVPPETAYDDMVAADPTNPVGYYRRGIAHHAEGLFEYALADFNRAIALDPTYADAYYWRASTYEEIGTPELIIADLSQVIALEPAGLAAYYKRGVVYLDHGDRTRAHPDFQRVIDLSDDPAVQERARNVLRGGSWIPIPPRPATGHPCDPDEH